MTQYGFFFDNTRCTGCRTCEMACKDYKDLSTEIMFRRIYDYEGGSWMATGDGTYTNDTYAYHVSISCNHCENPACLPNCPQSAISKDSDTGIVTIDPEKCIACGTCVTVCPYSAPKIDPVKNVSVKCDLCASRLAAGENPICVDACPLRALEYGDIEKLRSEHPDGVDAIAPLPKGDETKPSLVILACPAAKEPGDTTGAIVNQKEVTGVV